MEFIAAGKYLHFLIFSERVLDKRHRFYPYTESTRVLVCLPRPAFAIVVVDIQLELSEVLMGQFAGF